MEIPDGWLRPFPCIAVPVALPKAEETFVEAVLGFRQGAIPGFDGNPGRMGLCPVVVGMEEGKVGTEAGEQEQGQAEEPGAAAVCVGQGPLHGCFRG
jgi:hypothetical protein